MNRVGMTAVVALALSFGGARAQEPADARAVVDRAIEAAGGETRLSGLSAATWKTEATSQAGGQTRTSKATLHGQLPDRFRLDSTSVVNGKSSTYSKVLDGGKGWTVRDGQVKELDAEAIRETRATFYHKRLGQTLVPLKDKATRLTPLGTSVVADREAVGVLANRAGERDVKLYFDKETSLLLKTEMLERDERTGKAGPVEIYYSDHRKFGGLMLPGKTVTKRDGKAVIEVKLIDFEPKAKVDAKLFEKP